MWTGPCRTRFFNQTSTLVRALAQALKRITCGEIALLGGHPDPLQRLGFIFCNAIALRVSDTEIVLGGRVALVGGLAQPLYRLEIILRDAHSSRVSDSQIVLAFGRATFRRFAKPLHGLRFVPRDAVPFSVHQP